MNNEAKRIEMPILNGATIEQTDIPCPECAAVNRKNIGRATPVLRFLPAEPARLFCIGRHGYVTVVAR